MFEFLWLIPTLPFAGFLLLALFGKKLTQKSVAYFGAGSVGISALIAIGLGIQFITSPAEGQAFSQTLWTWIRIGSFSPGIALRLDALSLVMTLVITFVGFLIHLYSAEFMEKEEGYSRFFAYMNLFVGAMLMLVLADNLLLLYLGWEGVGLCSFLLIGFWYREEDNCRAARKAFIVTRVGDTAMAIGLFLLFTHLGTLNIQELMHRATQQWSIGSPLAVAAAALLLGSALGKSAQLPLQTWLPDAMAGPSPVSALIHAATMVTAGVYLIARTHVLFTLAPIVQSAVAIIGAATLLVAGFSALTQWDLKRVLAYSTISQIGYMFLALGVGAWSAAIFHFMTHAFFKALLFLAGGTVIFCLHHEHNMFNMGGLRRQLPVVFWTFLIGSASLAALPLVTAGFYSKDLILWQAWSSEHGSHWLWAAGLAGAFLTSIYTFRMVFLTFFGEAKGHLTQLPGRRMELPLIVLAVLSLIGGFVEMPETLGGISLFSHLFHYVFPEMSHAHFAVSTELLFQIVAAAVSLLGVYLAYIFYLRRPQLSERMVQPKLLSALHRFWFSGWGFDWLYDKVFVQPFVWLARINKNDFFDLIWTGIARFNQLLHRLFSRTQTGQVRWYAAGIVVGALLAIAIVMFI
jgi:NADH-quinone oxidoreductase subunit L